MSYSEISRQYPTDRELTLLGQINVGWSTLGTKLSQAENQLDPAGETTLHSFSEEEKSYIESVVQRAEAEDEKDAMRIRNLYKEHNELCSKCIKDDTKHLCSKCGAKPRNSVICEECDKLFCQKCKADDRINPCPICYNRQKLWMTTGAWFIRCFDVPTDIDIQDSSMQNAMMKKTTLSQAKSNAKRNQMCKIVATSMEERSKRLQHLLKRSEEMQVLKNLRTNKTRSLPAEAAKLFSSYGASLQKEHAQIEIPKLDSRKRSLSAGKIVPASRVHRRFSSFTATDNNNSFAQIHNLFPSMELPTSSSNFNFLGLHQMSRDGSDADVESICSTTDTKHLFAKRASNASIESNSFSRAQTASPTNQLQSSAGQHSLQLSDNERYLSDDEAYKRKRFSLTSLQYYNSIEPEDGPTLEFRLEYIPDECELKVQILRCTGLHELSNTYVKMYIMSGPGKCKKLKTSIVYKNEAPEFNEMHTFPGLSPAVINKRTIFLVVVNHCRFGSNKQIGATKVPLRKTRPNETIFFRKLLEANLPTQKSISSSELADRGKIYLGLEYCSNKEVLIVEIIKGAGLASQKSSCPNPYVKCYLVNGSRSTDHDGQLKRKTKVTYKTIDPVFDEEVEFSVAHDELHTKSLCVSVWDWNQTMRNTNIGEVWIDDCDPGWEEIIDTPDHRTRGWYNLATPTV